MWEVCWGLGEEVMMWKGVEGSRFGARSRKNFSGFVVLGCGGESIVATVFSRFECRWNGAVRCGCPD